MVIRARARPSRLVMPAATLLALAGCVVNAPMNPGNYGPLEYQTDRPGADYRAFDLPEARPDLCMAACNDEMQCVSFTYVNPGVQAPAPRCLLKSAAPDPVPNGCCVSGVVRAPLAAVGQPQPPPEEAPPPAGYPPPDNAAAPAGYPPPAPGVR